jgi:hypothetical protein
MNFQEILFFCTSHGFVFLVASRKIQFLERFKETSTKTFELIPFLYFYKLGYRGGGGIHKVTTCLAERGKISWWAPVSATKVPIGLECRDSQPTPPSQKNTRKQISSWFWY